MVHERYKTDSVFYLSGYRIIPVSAHSAYDKAAQYFKIKLWRVPVDQEFKADVKAIKRRINRNTILVRLYSDTFRLLFFLGLTFLEVLVSPQCYDIIYLVYYTLTNVHFD